MFTDKIWWWVPVCLRPLAAHNSSPETFSWTWEDLTRQKGLKWGHHIQGTLNKAQKNKQIWELKYCFHFLGSISVTAFWNQCFSLDHEPNSVPRRLASDISQTQNIVYKFWCQLQHAGWPIFPQWAVFTAEFWNIIRISLMLEHKGVMHWEYCSYTISFHFNIPCFIAPVSVLLCPWWRVFCSKRATVQRENTSAAFRRKTQGEFWHQL